MVLNAQLNRPAWVWFPSSTHSYEALKLGLSAKLIDDNEWATSIMWSCITNTFLMGQPRPLFLYFPFSHQVELNSDRKYPSRPLYPLDHNHGPNIKTFSKYWSRCAHPITIATTTKKSSSWNNQDHLVRFVFKKKISRQKSNYFESLDESVFLFVARKLRVVD